MKFIETRKDVSVLVICLVWLSINIIAWSIWGSGALCITNPAILLLLSIYVFYVKSHKKIDSWLETKIGGTEYEN